ncbi:MAG: hypothetical protein JWO17_3248 [Actinomycetia bacterium]|nr:hypothetical protein [Actinomycetes bacterium]
MPPTQPRTTAQNAANVGQGSRDPAAGETNGPEVTGFPQRDRLTSAGRVSVC